MTPPSWGFVVDRAFLTGIFGGTEGELFEIWQVFLPHLLEVFLNEILAACQPVSLAIIP